jgi:hypothetical protein
MGSIEIAGRKDRSQCQEREDRKQSQIWVDLDARSSDGLIVAH